MLSAFHPSSFNFMRNALTARWLAAERCCCHLSPSFRLRSPVMTDAESLRLYLSAAMLLMYRGLRQKLKDDGAFVERQACRFVSESCGIASFTTQRADSHSVIRNGEGLKD